MHGFIHALLSSHIFSQTEDSQANCVAYIDIDNTEENEETAREGDITVYDQLMQHDVYHTLGRPLDDSELQHDADNNQHPVTDSQVDSEDTQIPPVEDDSTHGTEHENSTTADFGNFIDSELSNPETLENFCNDENILDSFDMPTDFISDVDEWDSSPRQLLKSIEQHF